MILGKNKFKCRKCEEVLELKHLVWFVKHYKYCGIDDIKANEVLKVNDVEERVFKPVFEKKNSRDMDFLYVLDKPKLKEMSRFLLGKIYDAIWGCRKCYQPFDCEEALTNHINSAHGGKLYLLIYQLTYNNEFIMRQNEPKILNLLCSLILDFNIIMLL
jgi:hypothetical protein